MLICRPRLLTRKTSLELPIPLDAGADVKQATLSFYACGMLPMQHLRFTFLKEDGTAWPDQGSRQLPPCDVPARSFRFHPFVLLAEYLARLLLRKSTVYFLDLEPAMLAQRRLSVRIENGGAALVAGNFRLSTSALARDRPLRNTHPIEGYSDRQSVVAGEFLDLYVHAPLYQFSITVMRYGGEAETLCHCDGIEGFPQDYKADAYERGAGWVSSYRLATSAAWRSGLYAARISDKGGLSFDITFIVKAAPDEAPPALAVLASTNTWQAYNTWGGASFYRYDLDDGLDKPCSFLVHALRPNPSAALDGDIGHLANTEKHILGWLEKNARPYHLFCDRDLHEVPELLAPFGTLIVSTHSEYWTEAMYQAVERFLARGGNLVYLSGNGFYWKTVLRGGQQEVRFDHSRHTLADEAGGRWRDLGRRETSVTGIRFTRAGYTNPASPYKVLAPSHWIFEGTGVRRGDLIGGTGLNRGGASGWELDKIDPKVRPAGMVHLAKGTNRWRTGADMTCFTHAGGGGVFSVGSITFGGSLAVDPILSRILANVLDRFGCATALPHRAGEQ